MIIKSYLTSYLFKHALGASLAVFIAVVVNHYFAFSQTGWIILAAFLVGQATHGTLFRQGMIFSVVMIIAALIAFFLMKWIDSLYVICIAAVVFMTSGYILFVNQPMQNKTQFRMMLFAFLLLIAALSSVSSSASLQNQIIDILIGAGIGIICAQFVVRVRAGNEFQQGLIPILQASGQYSQVVTDYFLRRDNERIRLIKGKMELEKSLQARYGLYPEWVYEVGFNPGLRSGFRFYLINVERMAEIFFSMDYLATRGIETDLILKVSDSISAAMQKNTELINILIEYFEKNKLKNIDADFTSDISELDNAVSRVVPGHLELLDISLDYITLTAFVRDMKDLRKVLLQLVMALPASRST